MLTITNHRLFVDNQPVPFIKSPNVGGELVPEYLVLHYTAGVTVQGAVATLTNPKNQVSAHLVIGRDGSITQLVPFNQVAFHAGDSYWEGRSGLNAFSIGIEIDNPGRLIRPQGQWRDGFGHTFSDDQVIEAAHKFGTVSYGWHVYPQAQIDRLLEVAVVLFQTYRFLEVVGHDDIAPRRKWDPGPAFPLDDFRANLLSQVVIEEPRYQTSLSQPLRSGPGSVYKTVPGSPLPKSTLLEKLGHQGNWFLVQALDASGAPAGLSGWVYPSRVRKV